LSTQLINPKFCVSSPHRRSTTVSLETNPLVCLKNLNTKEEAKGASPFSRLDPFLDWTNLVRIGRRTKRASISQDTKHPVVLPEQGHISKILARHYHKKAMYQGKGITFNEIRSSGYWIAGGGTMVSRLIHECVTCRRL